MCRHLKPVSIQTTRVTLGNSSFVMRTPRLCPVESMKSMLFVVIAPAAVGKIICSRAIMLMLAQSATVSKYRTRPVINCTVGDEDPQRRNDLCHAGRVYFHKVIK